MASPISIIGPHQGSVQRRLPTWWWMVAWSNIPSVFWKTVSRSRSRQVCSTKWYRAGSEGLRQSHKWKAHGWPGPGGWQSFQSTWWDPCSSRKKLAPKINMDMVDVKLMMIPQKKTTDNKITMYTNKMKTIASTNHQSRAYQKSARNRTRNLTVPESGTRKIQSRSRRRFSAPKVGSEIWTVCHQLYRIITVKY